MLELSFNRKARDCEGTTRRDFLRVGALGAGSVTLAHLLEARAQAAAQGTPTKNTSVVWLWLGGGPTHVETFDPKMTAPSGRIMRKTLTVLASSSETRRKK